MTQPGSNVPLPSTIPPTAKLRRIRFVTKMPTEGVCLFTFPSIIGRWAIEVDGGISVIGSLEKEDGCHIEWLSIPCDLADDDRALEAARQWVEADLLNSATQSVLMMLQRVTVVFSGRRVAVVGAAERLDIVGKSLVESLYYLSELQALEETLASSWRAWTEMLPRDVIGSYLNFEERKKISDIHAEILAINLRSARISASIHAPFVHPPTLESQIQERFRDRLQLAYRHEVLCEQVETLLDSYESTVQRINEHLHARSSNQLEWVIILLLGVQILMSIYDLLGSLGTN